MQKRRWPLVALIGWLVVSLAFWAIGSLGLLIYVMSAVVSITMYRRFTTTPEQYASRLARKRDREAQRKARQAERRTQAEHKRAALQERTQQRRAELKAAREQRYDLARRTLELTYLGGHPHLIFDGPCTIIRSEDGSSVTIEDRSNPLNKAPSLVSIPTSAIRAVELVPQTKTLTKRKSGVGGAIAGDLIAGPVGGVIGGMASRRTQVHTERDDMLQVTIAIGEVSYQLLFKGPNKQSADSSYARAAAIWAPPIPNQELPG